jgi:hypothetical protein
MLPQRPQALDPDFASEISQNQAACPVAPPVEHHSQVCPNCGNRLTGHHCKLVCTQRGYSGSPIALHRKQDAQWLFPQEKATLHTTWHCTCFGEPLYYLNCADYY